MLRFYFRKEAGKIFSLKRVLDLRASAFKASAARIQLNRSHTKPAISESFTENVVHFFSVRQVQKSSSFQHTSKNCREIGKAPFHPSPYISSLIDIGESTLNYFTSNL